jgi:hypothetical protein
LWRVRVISQTMAMKLDVPVDFATSPPHYSRSAQFPTDAHTIIVTSSACPSPKMFCQILNTWVMKPNAILVFPWPCSQRAQFNQFKIVSWLSRPRVRSLMITALRASSHAVSRMSSNWL